MNSSSPKTAAVTEIFSSLQGEGTHAGEKHLFVRFEECHLHCQYCDEPNRGGKEYSVPELLDAVLILERSEGPHAYVSLTGGEPLLYADFLKSFIPHLKSSHLKVYLETNGVLWRELEKVIDLCDCVAMDMKLPSVTGERSFSTEHRSFLEIAKHKEALVKFVLSKTTDVPEFEECLTIVREVAPSTPVILQPISTKACEGHDDPELMQILGHFERLALRYVTDVRIVPRLHRILNIH